MEVNPAPTAKSSAIGHASAGPARLAGVAVSSPDLGSTPRIEPVQKATLRASDDQVRDTNVKIADSEDRKTAERLRTQIGDKNMQLRTYHDEASGRSVLEVSDQTTGKVVNKYPSDELLRLYAALREPLVDQNA